MDDVAITAAPEATESVADAQTPAPASALAERPAASPAAREPSATDLAQGVQRTLERSAPVKALEPPTSWNKQAREHWGRLPPDLQEYVHARERDAHRQISELGQRAGLGRDLDGALQPVRAVWGHQQDYSDTEAIRRLGALAHTLETNPKAGIVHLMAHSRLSPLDFIDTGSLTAERQQLVSQVYEVGAKLANALEDNDALRKRIAELESGQKAQLERSRKDVEDAKRAASINVRSSGRGVAPVKRGTWEDTLHDVADRVLGR